MKVAQRGDLLRYYGMPKDFVGHQEADVLFGMYERLREVDMFGYQFAAASAAAESGLMGTYLTPEERHFRIHCADQAWQAAAKLFLEKHAESGWSESHLESIPDRVEMNRLFVPVYHDLVDENVREVTLARTHHRLIKLGLRNLRMHDYAEQEMDVPGFVMRRGLGYELGTIMTITRLNCPSFFAIPASARADHGAFYPEETHDVRLIRQSWGSIEQCIPYEVKPNDGLTRDRYRSAFVRGRVELMMPSATQPLDLALYMEEEENGTISAEHYAELNEITSRVLRQAVDYTNSLSLGDKAINAVA